MKAKLINERLFFAPSTIVLENGTAICNPTDEQLIGQGYKEVVYEERPTVAENEIAKEVYTESDTITVSYNILEKMSEEISEIENNLDDVHS